VTPTAAVPDKCARDCRSLRAARYSLLDVEAFPWERRGELGFVRAFADNLVLSIRAPGRFYALEPRAASFWPAVAYGFVFELVVALATFAYAKTVGEAEMKSALAPLYPQIEEVLPDATAKLDTLLGTSAWASLLLCPIGYLLQVFSFAAVTWVGLRIARGLHTSFGHLVRLLAYANWVRVFGLLGTTDDLVLSFTGALLSLGVGSYVWVVLVRSSQRIDLQRTILASVYGTLVALVVGCVCAVPPAVLFAVWLVSKLAPH
jgi:hypothetical protein